MAGLWEDGTAGLLFVENTLGGARWNSLCMLRDFETSQPAGLGNPMSIAVAVASCSPAILPIACVIYTPASIQRSCLPPLLVPSRSHFAAPAPTNYIY